MTRGCGKTNPRPSREVLTVQELNAATDGEQKLYLRYGEKSFYLQPINYKMISGFEDLMMPDRELRARTEARYRKTGRLPEEIITVGIVALKPGESISVHRRREKITPGISDPPLRLRVSARPGPGIQRHGSMDSSRHSIVCQALVSLTHCWL
ncbi:hypothetical protein PoB_005493100 [Plakobranchus ocellatus]|uniref:Uncharacterized protein n=1 Tax=Plakobranchus ocellatus TaxID=259542 RepID=A0AAV4CAS6_9GAST|nr:hypothetical protein PoB_005493100 [Plakobranchus ocellatus]